MAELFTRLAGGDQAELFARTLRDRQARFMNSRFDGTSDSINRLASLRLIANGRMSLATSTKPGGEADLLAAARSTVAYGTPVAIALPGPAQLADIPLSDEVGTPELGSLVDRGEDLAQALLDYDARIMAFSEVEYTDAELRLENSRGFVGDYRKTVWRGELGGQLVQGDDILLVGAQYQSCSSDLDWAALKREVIQLFEWSKTIVPCATGNYPVVFAPEQVAWLVEPLLACLDGKAVARGISPWRNRLGEQLLDPRFTMVDDGTLPMLPSSCPFDREGVPTRRNVLIDRGIASQLVLDLQTAKELGRASTGNGTAAGPMIHRAIVAPGELHSDELIKSIGSGLLIVNSMGAWAGNPYSGIVSGTISLGLMIKHGAIVGRVKDCVFTVNVFEAFRRGLIALSSNTGSIRAGLGEPGGTFPYVALGDVVIAAK